MSVDWIGAGAFAKFVDFFLSCAIVQSTNRITVAPCLGEFRGLILHAKIGMNVLMFGKIDIVFGLD